MIPETLEIHAYDPTLPKDQWFVFPGRASDWEGKDLYDYKKFTAAGPSRHLTFIFTAFVFM